MGETSHARRYGTYLCIWCVIVGGGVIFAVPQYARAALVVSEIMYDVPSDLGGDDTREWIEVMNTGSEDVDITGWKVNDGSNHVLNVPPKNGGTGSTIVPAGGYVIIADDAVVFSQMYPVGVSVIDSSLSLNNAGDTVVLVDREGSQVSAVTYEKSAGAAGDGNSLQLVGTYVAAIPTPGKANRSDAFVPEVQDESKKKKEKEKEKEKKKEEDPLLQAAETSTGLTVHAGDDRAVIVGVPVSFVAVGVMSAAYEWNFGDGTTGSGAHTTHTYAHSGRYTAVVSMLVDGQTVTDEIVVTVSGADVSLRVVPGGVEVKNNGRSDVDMSRWVVTSGSGQFSVHDNTRVAAGSAIVLTERVVGFALGEDTRLTLPDGKEMARVEVTVSAVARAVVASAMERVTQDAGTEETENAAVHSADAQKDERDTHGASHAEENDDGDDEAGAVSQTAAAGGSDADAGTGFPLWGAGIAGVLALGIVGIVALRAPAEGADITHESDEDDVRDDTDGVPCIRSADGTIVTADDFDIIEIPGEHLLL